MSKISLSIVILAKNEEERIRDCIKSEGSGLKYLATENFFGEKVVNSV